MLENGLIVTVVGMGVVFIFLTIQVFAMHLCAKIISVVNKFFPEQTAEETTKKKTPSSTDEEIAVAIAATKALS